jgi:hypothetical protein
MVGLNVTVGEDNFGCRRRHLALAPAHAAYRLLKLGAASSTPETPNRSIPRIRVAVGVFHRVIEGALRLVSRQSHLSEC